MSVRYEPGEARRDRLGNGRNLLRPKGFAYPLRRQIRESTHRLHGQNKMLLLRILDLVVADPVERLNEHHHGRDPCPSHFCR